VSGYIVVVSPEVTINPNSGSVNENTVLSGKGFGANQPLTIMYDSRKMETGTTTDAKGSFSTSFKPPPSGSGRHLITVSDLTQAVDSTGFTIEATAPSVPKPSTPAAGASFGMFDNQPVKFTWTEVEDPSGIKYNFEMSNKGDFSGTLLRRDNLDKAELTLLSKERPGTGDYYWRVKAIDGAGNNSEWSQSQLLTFSGLDFLFWPAAIAAGVLIILGLVIWRIRVISKKGGWTASPE
jgi:hypothetical protein